MTRSTRGERGDLKKAAGAVLKEKGVVARYSQGAARMRREGVGGRLGNGGKSYRCGISETKATCVYSSSLWNLSIFSRYSSLEAISIN